LTCHQATLSGIRPRRLACPGNDPLPDGHCRSRISRLDEGRYRARLFAASLLLGLSRPAKEAIRPAACPASRAGWRATLQASAMVRSGPRLFARPPSFATRFHLRWRTQRLLLRRHKGQVSRRSGTNRGQWTGEIRNAHQHQERQFDQRNTTQELTTAAENLCAAESHDPGLL